MSESAKTRITSGSKFRNEHGFSAIKDGVKRSSKQEATTAEKREPKPKWLRARMPGGERYEAVRKNVSEHRLSTVCQESHCPNIGECWTAGTATIMVMGSVCTRACKYCGVAHGMPNNLDLDEPRRVAEAVARLELEHVVVTSVNRDELPDGGAGIYAETITRIHELVSSCSVEVLIPDFKGDEESLRLVVEAGPAIIGHNLETVERLHPDVRPGGRYWRSISYLGVAKRINPGILTKTGIILGMGEEFAEVKQAKRNLSSNFIRIIKKERVHPFRISKYCMATATLFPELKRNNFKRKFLHLNKLQAI